MTDHALQLTGWTVAIGILLLPLLMFGDHRYAIWLNHHPDQIDTHCTGCHGSGQDPDYTFLTCTYCGGTGIQYDNEAA